MPQSQYITIPATAADKLAELGQAMLKLANSMKLSAQPGVVVKPRKVPKDQEWFWTKEWQAGERQADADLAAGRVSRIFDSADELIADLHNRV